MKLNLIGQLYKNGRTTEGYTFFKHPSHALNELLTDDILLKICKSC